MSSIEKAFSSFLCHAHRSISTYKFEERQKAVSVGAQRQVVEVAFHYRQHHAIKRCVTD